MNPSLFVDLVSKFFGVLVGKITEKINGSTKEQTLLHKTMLTEEYSPDLTWNATEIDNAIVAADVVSLDSSLPLKTRASISHASGHLPKIGIKYHRKESFINQINIMIARGADQATIVSKLFNDTKLCIMGMDIRKEIMFLEALSTGMCLVTDEENQGTGIRVSYGYKDANTFHSITAPWGETGYAPIDDLQQMFDKAEEDGIAIEHVYMSKKYFDLLRHSTQGKKLVANYKGQTITNVALLEAAGRTVMAEALADEFGAEFHYISSAFKVENLDGSKTTVKPFAEANIVAVPSNTVGRLVYGTLAEETNPTEAVAYEKSGSHVLISKYSKTDPKEEFTAAQALCIPVIDNAEGIYILHANASETGLTVVNDSMTFAAAGDTEETEIHYDGNIQDVAISVPSNASSWLSAYRRKNKLYVKAEANATNSSRTSTVTLTAGSYTETVSVSQGA